MNIKHKTQQQHRNLVHARAAFTLVEMLVAMTITLLLMAALAKSFGEIGQSVRASRAQVELSGDLRDITYRVREELSQCTVQPRAESGDVGSGYIVYYEGPGATSMGATLGQSPNEDNEGTFPDSGFADFDDYLAFTAAAEPDNPFRGKVPRFVLDMKTVSLLPENNDGDSVYVNYDPANFPGLPTDPVVITSSYAEIIYFAAPRYQVEPDRGNNAQSIHVHDPRTGDPLILDNDVNGLPDSLRLHRRVLLIRPDLNTNCDNPALDGSRLQAYLYGGYTYMEPDTWWSDTTLTAPSIKTVSRNGLRAEQFNNAWLIGMAPIHQQCDLSVHRISNVDGSPGLFVRANSLEDLTLPHRRFAHVRVPSQVLRLSGPTGAHTYSSMPALALGGVHPILANAATGTTPAAPPMGALPRSPRAAAVVTPMFLNGFLRPEFVLGRDYTHTDLFGDGWGIERVGEDVLASGILGFDVKVFDDQVINLLHPGPDGRFGSAGADDDSNSVVDDISEAGYVGSDDQLITSNDPDFGWAITKLNSANLASGESTPVFAQPGGFVDLGYPVLAGGNVRGFGRIRRFVHLLAPQDQTNFEPNRLAYATPVEFQALSSRFSAYDPDSSYTPAYADSLFDSGKILTDASNRIVFFQPVFDSYTDHYERDGDLQASATNGSGKLWWFKDSTGAQRTPLAGNVSVVDAAANGIDDVTYTVNGSGSPVITNNSGLGTDVRSERETNAPFAVDLSALRVTVRLENSKAREIEQSSVVHHFQ